MNWTFFAEFMPALIFFMGVCRGIEYVADRVTERNKQKATTKHFEKTERYRRGIY